MTNYFFAIGLILLAASCGSPGKSRQSHPNAVRISDSLRKAGSVYLTSDEKDNPVISWSEMDSGKKYFYASFFDAASGKFASAINIPIEPNASVHEEGMPKVAIKGDGTIIAVYETSAPTGRNIFAGAVYYLVSADKGKSWTKPVRVHADTSRENSHSFASIARLSDGEIGACWLGEPFDEKAGARPVKFAKTNRENKFEHELIIDSAACQCCRTAISSGTNGKIAVAYRDIISDSIRDISVSFSTDIGKTFTPPSPFSDDGWAINGCPHNGPSVAVSDNAVYAAWFTGGRQKGVYYAEVNGNGAAVNKQLVSRHGRFVQLCPLADGGQVLAYDENIHEDNNTSSKIVLNKIEHGRVFGNDIYTGKAVAGYPVIRSFAGNKIVVAWTSSESVYYALTTADAISEEIQRPAIADAPATPDFSGVKLAGSIDLVCKMPLSLSPADTASFKGQVYGFCSASCKERFVKDTASFLKR